MKPLKAWRSLRVQTKGAHKIYATGTAKTIDNEPGFFRASTSGQFLVAALGLSRCAAWRIRGVAWFMLSRF